MADACALLKQLINCKSVTPEQGGALDLAEEFLRGAGFAVRRLPAGNVDNLWAEDGGGARLLFAGHVDVVPPGDLALWDSPPFAASERGGFIYGRGAADMKSGVAAILRAAANLRRRGVGGVTVLLTSDEEGPALHGTRHVAAWLQKNGAPKIPYAVLGEPTCEAEFGDTIKIGRRGSLTARIAVLGKQTHAAYPHLGDNPVHRLCRAAPEILRRAAELSEENGGGDFPPLGAQFVRLESGVADNVIPSQARATLNFRYAPSTPPEILRRMTEECLENAAPGQWTCEWTEGAAPFLTQKDGVLVRTLRDAVFAVCGKRAALSTGGGTSDGRFLRAVCEEIAEFGVQNGTMHAPNERAEAQSVRQLAEIYELLAEKLCAGQPKTAQNGVTCEK